MFGGKADKVDVPKTTAVTKQKLSTYFEDDGIKVNWECIDRDWFPSLGLRCDENVIEEIEATVTIPANGGSNFNGTSANQVGQLESMAMIARFINEEITTERVVTLMAQNVEKADDTYRNPIDGTNQNNVNAPRLPAVVGITSSEPMAPRDPNTPNMNFAVRSNINDTVRELNTIVRGNAQAIMRGTTFDVDQKDDQLIQITATWRRDRADAVQNKIQSYFQ
jgi:hypothetical protein|tara:strand:- start:97 stop:762 length:666 start_codon:yes stop_codon:yes gene_type:complete